MSIISERTKQMLKALGTQPGCSSMRTAKLPKDNSGGEGIRQQIKPLKEINVNQLRPSYADMPWDELEITLNRGYHEWESVKKRPVHCLVQGLENEPQLRKQQKKNVFKKITNTPPSPIKISTETIAETSSASKTSVAITPDLVPTPENEPQLRKQQKKNDLKKITNTPPSPIKISTEAIAETSSASKTSVAITPDLVPTPENEPQLRKQQKKNHLKKITNTPPSPINISTEAIAETSTIQAPSSINLNPLQTSISKISTKSSSPIVISVSPSSVITSSMISQHPIPFVSSDTPLAEVINSLSPGELLTLDIPVSDLPNLTCNNFEVLSSESENVTNPRSKKRLFEEAVPNENTDKAKPKRKKRCDRRNCCIFCDCILTNLTRHMIRQHSKEKQVAEYLALLETCPKESKSKRMAIMEELRLKGNYNHNNKTLTDATANLNTDSLLPLKRPPVTKEKRVSDFITCSICQSLLLKRTFFKHAQYCLAKEKESNCESNPSIDDNEQIDNQPTNFVKKYGLQTHPQSKSATHLMKDVIFPMLHKDVHGLTAMNDDLIVSTCNDYLHSHSDPKDRTIVTRKMRDAAKLLYAVSNKSGDVKSLKDIFFTHNVENIIGAVQELCVCSDDGEVGIVGMPARLSWVIFECGKRHIDDILSSRGLSDIEKKIKKNEVKNCLELVRRRWKYYISTNAERSRTQKKILKEKIIPPSEDVLKFGKFLEELSETCYNNLNEKINIDSYNELCKASIAQIITLNARRPLEAAKIKLQFFIFRPRGQPVNKELLQELTEDERKSFDHLSEFYVPGKNGRDCSVLLTKSMERNLELIVKCRDTLNIAPSNKYLFARPGMSSTFDGSAVMRELRNFAVLKRPEFMTANGIRHHHATMGTLKGREFTSNLSNHMSHTLDVHNKNYCYPIDIINRGRVGHFLLGLQGVNLSGNSLGNKHDIRLENSSEQVEESLMNTISSKKCSQRPDEQSSDDSAGEDWLPNSINSENLFIKSKKKRWTDLEKKVVITEFIDFLRMKKNPGPTKCRKLIEKNPILSSRTPTQVNTFIDNVNKNKLKLSDDFRSLIQNN